MSEEPIDSNSTSTGLAPNVGAGLACLLTFITGLIFLLLEKKNDFIRYWASQALVVGVAWFAFSVIIRIASTIFSQIPALGGLMLVLLGLISLAVSLGGLVLWVVMLIKSFGGQRWDVPILAPYAVKVLEKFPKA